MINRSSLYYIASVIWGIPGVIITVKGVSAYFAADKSQLWWLMPITALVLTGFLFMFSRIVSKYCGLIRDLPERTSPFKTFPVRGWVIVVFMMCLGMALKIIGVPVEFTASFYSGLGPALLTAAILFLKKRRKGEFLSLASLGQGLARRPRRGKVKATLRAERVLRHFNRPKSFQPG